MEFRGRSFVGLVSQGVEEIQTQALAVSPAALVLPPRTSHLQLEIGTQSPVYGVGLFCPFWNGCPAFRLGPA